MVINIDKPRYDQRTYWGRARHFISVTNPLNLLASESDLDQAALVIKTYRSTGRLPPYYDENRLWSAKSLYDSAFHPDTGEKMFILGRMSAQAPMNTLITGCMITFYKTTRATIFWQWVNQSFNALVNYTNRSGSSPMSPGQLGASYVAATGGALGTALYLNSLTKVFMFGIFTTAGELIVRGKFFQLTVMTMSPIWGKMVPFGAVCAANCINIPMMRSQELIEGTPVFTESDKLVGNSRKAAAFGISLVVVSRIIMAMPGMTLTPFLTSIAQKRGLPARGVLPFQLGLVALCVTFATPLCCAIFEQRAALDTGSLEPELKTVISKIEPNARKVFFNKGL